MADGTAAVDELPAQAEVVIVGGGIVGCATAYYLARRGVDVVLVDKGRIGYEQSTRNWGWVHQQVRYPHLIPLALESVRIWHGLGDELDADLEWVQGGNLSLGFEEADLVAFKEWQADARDQGLESEILTEGQVREMLPGSEGQWKGALHIPTDGQANPDLVTGAFARAAAGLGVQIRTNCAALRIETTGGAVTAVVTEHGTIQTGRVVCAAGAWSARFARSVGVRFPQRAVRGTVVRTAPMAPMTDVTAWGDGFTFRQDRQGRFILASGARAVYDVTLDLVRDLRQFAPWPGRTVAGSACELASRSWTTSWRWCRGPPRVGSFGSVAARSTRSPMRQASAPAWPVSGRCSRPGRRWRSKRRGPDRST